MLELIFLEGGQQGQSIRLSFEKAWFGRQTTCEFVLLGEGTSRVHFSIVRRGTDYILIDNKSHNGTSVNGVRVSEKVLRAGDDIVAGSNRMQVREVAAQYPFSLPDFVADWKGEQVGVQLIEQETVLLGRKSICPIQLNDPAVSPVHAALEHRRDGVWITDRSSGAGVYVNGQRVVEQQLRDGGGVVTIRPFEDPRSLSPMRCAPWRFTIARRIPAAAGECTRRLPGCGGRAAAPRRGASQAVRRDCCPASLDAGEGSHLGAHLRHSAELVPLEIASDWPAGRCGLGCDRVRREMEFGV